ncbi:hypothetical protein SAMN06296036_101226 [Pseudobacteriovorax antillogorgiicola]|uniref:Uncharacterized protein n=2 Tax=Pseudobacteriovorax antillogorgiicola TaxID=1513793 RepID=A0A1Y6B370_9BACT|nr:hypothetical protein EDD56_101260 [Pseudobacteriovorax antillogorgiicola]SME89096.1 hypothetical protein SAMN06296036_101226 [Pseudobacteriovorax antillogorgiicola]
MFESSMVVFYAILAVFLTSALTKGGYIRLGGLMISSGLLLVTSLDLGNVEHLLLFVLVMLFQLSSVMLFLVRHDDSWKASQGLLLVGMALLIQYTESSIHEITVLVMAYGFLTLAFAVSFRRCLEALELVVVAVLLLAIHQGKEGSFLIAVLGLKEAVKWLVVGFLGKTVKKAVGDFKYLEILRG